MGVSANSKTISQVSERTDESHTLADTRDRQSVEKSKPRFQSVSRDNIKRNCWETTLTWMLGPRTNSKSTAISARGITVNCARSANPNTFLGRLVSNDQRGSIIIER